MADRPSLWSVKTYKLIIAALVCAVVIPLAFLVQVLMAR